MRVLIVDDNASMRNLLSTLLASHGYSVVGCLADGNTLIEAIEELSPEIICLDYILPGRDGLDLMQEINRRFPQIDVLFITASESPEVETQAADAGAAGFLRKPFGQKQVIDELNQVGGARRQATAANASEEAATVAAPPSRPARSGRPTAVIVDDNSSIRLLLKGLLNELGFEIVGQAANGKEAVQAASLFQPSVLLLDVAMPIMSGIEALPQVVAASPQTAVVMVTGDTSRPIVEQAAALGAKGYIVKPIRPAYVENLMKKMFARRTA